MELNRSKKSQRNKNLKNGNRKRNKTGIGTVRRYKTELDYNTGRISY
jgi:hypothetical protein